MSNGSWISLGRNITIVEVLKQEAIVKNFSYKEVSFYKIFKSTFTLEDVENTASNIRLELYKDNKLLQSKNLDKLSDYNNESMDVSSNGRYELKVIADINLNQDITEDNTVHFKPVLALRFELS